MRTIFLFITFFIAINSFAQTAQEHLDNGVEKHTNKDYKGAIKDYNKAIKKDNQLVSAYFNRGTVYYAEKNIKEALKDFNSTLELDSTFIKAYYSRATIYISQNQYDLGMADLDRTIELNERFPNALTLRGQVYCAQSEFEKGCADFTRALELGSTEASKYLKLHCGIDEPSTEILVLNWPEEENWKLADSQENDQVIIDDYLRNGENFDNWTELANMQIIKGIKGIPMDDIMNLMYEQTITACPKATLQLIEKDDNAEYPWVLFTIECDSYSDDNSAESQLWYVIQGKQSLYTNFRAIKSGNIPEETKDKWIEFFKTGEIFSSQIEK